MSISAIGGSQAGSALVTQRPRRGNGAMRKAFEAAANALGMSTDDLRSALRSGQTMTSLAQSKGVSTDTLTSAISGALTGANPSLSSTQAQEMAQRMIAGPPPGGGRGSGGPLAYDLASSGGNGATGTGNGATGTGNGATGTGSGPELTALYQQWQPNQATASTLSTQL